jgi:hypothetical protein
MKKIQKNERILLVWLSIGIGFPVMSLAIWHTHFDDIIQKIFSPERINYIWIFVFIFLELEAMGFILSLLLGPYVEENIFESSLRKRNIVFTIIGTLLIMDTLPFVFITLVIAALGITISPAIELLFSLVTVIIIYFIIKQIKRRRVY